jgi:hypothetical protein
MVAIVALLTVSCRDADVAAPGATAPHSAAKAASRSPTVSSTSPSSGSQGTIALDVHIFGSGFDPGSRASWQKNGQVYEKIVVNSTRYVSATELVANITIASDAAVDSYDVVVALAGGGKPGMGSEMFTVTLAVAIEEPIGRAVNDGGQIVGQSSGGAAALWDPTVGYVLLDAGGMVWDIDRSGTYIAGRNAAEIPVVWTSKGGPAGPWVETPLPSLGEGGAVRGVASDAAGVAVMMVGNAHSSSNRNTIVWTRTSTGWEHRIFPAPAGIIGFWGQAINRRGMVAGMNGSGCCYAAFWDSLGTPTLLQPITSGATAAAWSIDDVGTIIVGQSNGIAVMWTRTFVNGVYGPWSGAKALESSKTTCKGTSIANAVNGAGKVAVGSSCGGAVVWIIDDGVVVERRVLVGLGPPNTGAAFGINDLPNPIVTGQANNGGVYWRSF